MYNFSYISCSNAMKRCVDSFFLHWYVILWICDMHSKFHVQSYWWAVNSCDSFVQDSLCKCILIETIDGASLPWNRHIQRTLTRKQYIFKIAGSLKWMEWKIMFIILWFAVSKEEKNTLISSGEFFYKIVKWIRMKFVFVRWIRFIEIFFFRWILQ